MKKMEEQQAKRRSIFLKGIFLLFIFCQLLHFSQGKCFSFLSKNIGGISPDDVPVVQEGTTLTLNCTLNDSYAAEHSLTSHDIIWQKAAQSVVDLSAALESRMTLAFPDQLTNTFILRNVTQEDSAPYRCAVLDRKRGVNQTICSAAVTVAGPPQKYKNFQCLSENLMNLRCWWERGDTYPALGATKYSLKFHLLSSSSEKTDYECPHPSYATGSLNPRSYECRWEKLSRKSEIVETLRKPLVRPNFYYGYVYNMTINGTNDLGTQLWTEIVTVSQYVRPAAPTQLKALIADEHSCTLSWQQETVESFKRDSKLLFRIEYQRKDQSHWQAEDGIETEWWTLETLNANTVYRIRVRAYPGDGTGLHSNWTETFCETKMTVPEDAPGLVPGAYEEFGNGALRQVTLYWKGIPPEHYNGPDFAYKVYVKDSPNGEERFLCETEFANQPIPAPSNHFTTVRILPTNAFGNGKISEEVVIPALRNEPFAIRFANVVKFNSTLYEVTWATNKPEETILVDLYWCPTSNSSHLARCTTTMEHLTVEDKRGGMNLTVRDGHNYRFAVSARGLNGQETGMLWVGRQCSIHDREPWLDSLQVTPLANASAKVTWKVPCQHRVAVVPGYRVDYYLCRQDRPAECMQNAFDVVVNGSEHVVRGLLPEQSYCFEVSVLEGNVSGTAWTRRPEAKCLFTAPSTIPLPIGSIVGGSVAGGFLLVILAFVVWRAMKRVRKGFQAIQKESRRIEVPNFKLDRYNNKPLEKEDAHYTKVDLNDEVYVRQLSDGIGSMDSAQTNDTTAKETILPAFDSSLLDDSTHHLISPSLRHQTDTHSHNGSMVSLPENDEKSSVGNKARVWAGSLTPDTNIEMSLPSRPGSTHFSLTHSGMSQDTHPTSEYVTTASFQPGSGSSNGHSSGPVTGDTGYISHPASLSSSGPLTGGSDDSGASSGFADLDSPLQRKRNLLEPLIWTRAHSDSVDSHVLQDRDDTGSDASPPSSPTIAVTTKLLGVIPQKAPLDGYVAWP